MMKIVDVVSNDSQKRIAMTEEQQEIWMGFIREDKTYTKYYDEFVVLLDKDDKPKVALHIENEMRLSVQANQPVDVWLYTELLHHSS